MEITPFQKKIFTQVMWEYDFPPESVLDLLNGKIESLGHYTRETLFKKMLENLPWFTIVKLLPEEMILSLLTEDVIHKLRFKSLTRDYLYARKRL